MATVSVISQKVRKRLQDLRTFLKLYVLEWAVAHLNAGRTRISADSTDKNKNPCIPRNPCTKFGIGTGI